MNMENRTAMPPMPTVSASEILALGQAGVSWQEIRLRLGVCRLVIDDTLEAAGVRPVSKPVKTATKMSQRRFDHHAAVDAVAAGASMLSVAKRLGVHEHAVRSAVNRAKQSRESQARVGPLESADCQVDLPASAALKALGAAEHFEGQRIEPGMLAGVEHRTPIPGW